MANYDYITIPTIRLDPDWIQECKLGNDYARSTFISYEINGDRYYYYANVGSAESEFLCNTQEEFEQKVAEYKLLRVL